MKIGATIALVLSCASGVASAEEVAAARDSPRAAVIDYLQAAREGRFDDAGRHLAGVEADEAARTARRLKLVLDRGAWLDVAALSGASTGDLEDGLAPDEEVVATLRGEDVRLVRAPAGRPAWRFSAATTARVDEWYASLDRAWLYDRMPDALLLPGPFEVLRWQWLALPALAVVAWFVGGALSRVARRALVALARRTRSRWDDEAVARVHGPLTLAGAVVAAFPLVLWLQLVAPAEAGAWRILKSALFVCFFWAALRTIDVVATVVARSPWSALNPAARPLVSLGARTGKVAVVAVAFVAVLSSLGYPVASLLAGLGIGGLAVALAAQKTFENLFGAFAVGVDQPFREGDFVKIDDFVGTVEAVGLRSTRVRTLDRTLITVPNGQLAEKRVESYAERDRIRLYVELGLVYGTTSGQMRAVMDGLQQVLRAHPKIWPDAIITRFAAFDESSLRIEVMAWFTTTDFDEFCLIRTEVLLDFMAVVERAGSGFAFPTRTLHVAVA